MTHKTENIRPNKESSTKDIRKISAKIDPLLLVRMRLDPLPPSLQTSFMDDP